MSRNSVGYVIGFAIAVCLVCSLLVSGAAVALKDRQAANALADKQKKVLVVAGILDEGDKVSNEEANELFAANIQSRAVDLRTGTYADEGAIDLGSYDQRKASKDASLSEEAPENDAKVQRVPHYAVVYQVMGEADQVDQVILPIQGAGLWSTLYGFIAIEADGDTIGGITFYEHGETPGLGGEVDNPRWKALWPGRKLRNRQGDLAIQVIKGAAAPASNAPNKVDGLSGATLTSNGVTNALHFWLGPDAFGPYLSTLKG